MRTVKLTTKYNTVFKCVCGNDTFLAKLDRDMTSEKYYCKKCGMYCGHNRLKSHASTLLCKNYTYAIELKE